MFFAFSMSIVNLFLYCTQQLGVTLGVGAVTVLLVAYLQAMRDGTVDEKEQGFTRTARGVMNIGLMLIILSGLGVIATQFLSGTPEAFFSTIFLFKWSLIGIVLFFALGDRGSSLASELVQGVAAGTWYALFVVHILAPDAGWLELGQLYGLWLVGFMLCWTALVFALRGKAVQKSTFIASKTVAQPAVVITPNKTTAPPRPAPGPAFVPPKPAPVPIVSPPPPVLSPVVNQEPKQNPVIPPSPAPIAIPVPPPPPPPPIVPPVPPPPAPAPVPPPPPPAALTGLHVMPRTLEDIAKRKGL